MTEDLTRGFAEESAQVSSDLQDELMTGAEGAETLTGQADGMLIDRPEPGETLEVTAAPGETYVLNFDPSEAQTLVEGGNLVLIFGDGSRIVFEGLVELAQAGEAPAVQYAGEVRTAAQ